jgi:GTP-binding protein
LGFESEDLKITARFIKSSADAAHFPAAGAPEIAFAGRSNVGKSSLLNSLIGARLAHVSSTPGRTRTINFFAIHEGKAEQPALLFADLPGYGYAKISKAISAEWPKFIEPYLRERETLALTVVLVDSGVPTQASDVLLVEWLEEHRRPYLLVATKTDRLSGNQRSQALRRVARDFDTDEVVPYSVKTGAGREELWRRIRAAARAALSLRVP